MQHVLSFFLSFVRSIDEEEGRKQLSETGLNFHRASQLKADDTIPIRKRRFGRRKYNYNILDPMLPVKH